MARHALLLARKHGETQLTALGHATDAREVTAQFKKLLTEPGDLAHIEVWTSDAGRTKRKSFITPGEVNPAAEDQDDGNGEGGAGEPLMVTVPLFEEVVAAGYTTKAAKVIIARAEAQVAAVKANPAITKEELAAISDAVGEAPAPKK